MGNDPVDHFDPTAIGSSARLAAQPQLGLRAKRGIGPAASDRSRPGFAEGDLILLAAEPAHG